jgi:hypothetical protein
MVSSSLRVEVKAISQGVKYSLLAVSSLQEFGNVEDVRPPISNLNPGYCLQTYASHFRNPDGSQFSGNFNRPAPGAPHLLGTTDDIENLRPRTPPPGSMGQ